MRRPQSTCTEGVTNAGAAGKQRMTAQTTKQTPRLLENLFTKCLHPKLQTDRRPVDRARTFLSQLSKVANQTNLHLTLLPSRASVQQAPKDLAAIPMSLGGAIASFLRSLLPFRLAFSCSSSCPGVTRKNCPRTQSYGRGGSTS